MLDILLWPIVERLAVLKLENDYEAIPENIFAKFYRWREAMMETPAVQNTYLTPEVHLAYIKGTRSKVFNYDPENV